MSNLIEILDVKEDSNVYIVGDLHGCYDLLISELKKNNFDFEKDLLVAVGDLVDRGKDSHKCVDLIGEKWFKTIMGNHEDYCIMGYNDVKGEDYRIYHKMSNNGGAWFYKLPFEEQTRIVKIFKELPILIEINYKGKKYGVVHADIPFEDWELTKASVEAKDDLPNGRSVIDYCLWSRNLIESNRQPNIAFVDYVFIGHTVLEQPIRKGNCVFIDTGAVFYDKLTIIKL